MCKKEIDKMKMNYTNQEVNDHLFDIIWKRDGDL